MSVRTIITRLRYALPLMVCCIAVQLSAQPRFEMAVRGGASMLMYQSDFGSMQPSYDFGVDLLFNYRSEHVVGFRGGVAVDFAQSKFRMTNYTDKYLTHDVPAMGGTVPATQLSINYTIADVTESHNQLYVSVPLQLGLNFGNFAIFLGPKVAFPMKATFKQELTDVDVQVFYPEYGVTINGNEKVFDFNEEHASRYFSYTGDITNVKALNKKSNINIFASVDINYYIPVSKTSSFGIGLYADYALPFLYRHSVPYNEETPYKNSLLWIDDPANPANPVNPVLTRAHNSVLDAYNLQAGMQDPEVPQVPVIRALNYLSAGIRLSYNIGGERKEKYRHQYKDLKICHCVFTN